MSLPSASSLPSGKAFPSGISGGTLQGNRRLDPAEREGEGKTMQRTFCVGFSETECAAQGLGATFAKVDAGNPGEKTSLFRFPVFDPPIRVIHPNVTKSHIAM